MLELRTGPRLETSKLRVVENNTPSLPMTSSRPSMSSSTDVFRSGMVMFKQCFKGSTAGLDAILAGPPGLPTTMGSGPDSAGRQDSKSLDVMLMRRHWNDGRAYR
ncbi:hypothetical protein HPB50_000863 [Hyalomma asiaticum]|uniref:Uncharacterized protein n=1 Tax=Hyalomma asiaticum TaxID=266040 RepID=A0ACB7SAS5_HYAAI|nr:hypothetical protein HPB50_000863 [Hyalomma asiaticum]